MFKFLVTLYRAAVNWVEAGGGYYAAAFSYYAPLALVPLVLFSVTAVGLIYGQSFTVQVFSAWGATLGDDLLALIEIAISNLETETRSAKIPIIAITFFLGFYIIAMNILSDAFLKLWGREESGFIKFFKKSLRSALLLVILQVYLILVIGIEYFVVPSLLGANSLISAAFLFLNTTLLFAALYRWLASTTPDWASCFVGAVVSSVLFVVIKTLVDIYIATTPVISLYGAAGLILVLLVWVYVMAVIALYGASVTGLYAKMRNKI
jgi:membrane protein